MCTGITPVPPGPVPPPQPVFPIPSGGGGAAGGGGGLFVSMPGYPDPYEPPKEAYIIEGEMVEAQMQQAEVRAAIERVLGTRSPPERIGPDELVDRIIRQAEVRAAVDDAVQRDREERSWEDEARVFAARLWADLQARQAVRERDEAHERELRAMRAALQDADDRWQGLRTKVQQLEQTTLPPPAPATQLVVLPVPQQPDASLRRLWVGVAVTAAIVATAVFALALLKPPESPPPAPAMPPKRKRRRRR